MTKESPSPPLNAGSGSLLLALEDGLRPLVDPLEVQAAAAAMLGELLAADRVRFLEAGDAPKGLRASAGWTEKGLLHRSEESGLSELTEL